MLIALSVILALSTTPVSAGILPVRLEKAWNRLGESWPDLLLNLVAEGFGIFITIFVIERFINRLEERRQDQVWLPMKRQRCTRLLRSMDDLLRQTLVRGEHYEEETVEFPWEADEDPYSSVRVVRRDFNSPSTRLTIQKKVQSDGIDFAVIRTSGTEILKVTETDSSGRLLSPEILVKLAKLCEEIEECTNGTYANEDEKIDQLTHVAKTAFDAKSVIEAELFPRTKSSLIRKAWPRSQFAVTVLEGERVIAFQDPLPNRATFTQNQTIRGNREGLREYWCWLDDTLDNGTMANLTVDDKPPPSSLIDARPGLMRVGKRFSRPLAQGEETRVTLCCDLVDAFRTKGQYTFKILRMSKKELFKVQFHRERRCHSIKVFRSYGRVREKLVKEQHFGPDDGEVFEYVVDSPNFGEVYRFEWDW